MNTTLADDSGKINTSSKHQYTHMVTLWLKAREIVCKVARDLLSGFEIDSRNLNGIADYQIQN